MEDVIRLNFKHKIPAWPTIGYRGLLIVNNHVRSTINLPSLSALGHIPSHICSSFVCVSSCLALCSFGLSCWSV